MFCQKCGIEIHEDTNFCQNCGCKISKNTTEHASETDIDANKKGKSVSDIENKDKSRIIIASALVFIFVVIVSNVINKFYAAAFLEQSLSFTLGKTSIKHYVYHFLQQIPIIFIAFPAATILVSKLLKIEKDKIWFVFLCTATAFITINAIGWLLWDTKFVLCLINSAMYISVIYKYGEGNPYFKKFMDEK